MNDKEQGHSDVVVGLQYGDEGKGKIVDQLSSAFDIIGRFNGSHNAGHTIDVQGKKIVLHMIPSGVCNPNIKLYIGSGCVINPLKLQEEIQELKEAGMSLDGRITISDKVGVICPHNILFDELNGKELGTTGNGVGSAYADRALRKVGPRLKHIQIAEILADRANAKKAMVQNLVDLIENSVGVIGEERASQITAEIEQVMESYLNAIQELADRNFITPDPLFLEQQLQTGKNVLFEGAQAAGLDVTHGTVPYVTASHTLAGGAYTGGDIPPQYHRKTYGVAKALMSRVGNGPFVSELGGEQSEQHCAQKDKKGHTLYTKSYEAEQFQQEELLNTDDLYSIGVALRMLSGEYGSTTGRPRRIGMLDLVQLRQNCRLNGVDELFVTKLDQMILYTRTKLKGIPLVTGYTLDGKSIDYVPTAASEQRKVVPVIEYFPFIDRDISPIKRFQDLPKEAYNLCLYIEEAVGCCLKGVGVGPGREQMVFL